MNETTYGATNRQRPDSPRMLATWNQQLVRFHLSGSWHMIANRNIASLGLSQFLCRITVYRH